MPASQATDAGAPALPPRSGIRSRKQKAAWRVADGALEARQRILGLGRQIDRAARTSPRRRILVLGVYGLGGTVTLAVAVHRLRSSRHEVELALGALDAAHPALADETVCEHLGGGKFANLNRLLEAAAADRADWLLLLDDDVSLPRRFLDRLIYLSERFGLGLAQPALTLASHTAWEVTRRRPALVRRTLGVESGPVTLMRREVLTGLTPFPEEGMGWGVDLHWAAVAKRRGWKAGIVDAVPVRHERRPPATGYRHEEAVAAALAYLGTHEHLPYPEAARVIERYDRLS